jgi:hypothetical protein
VPAAIRYNYFESNYIVSSRAQLVATWPRSYAVGVFGVQPVNINFNRFDNQLIDFECVVALRV